MRIVAVVLGIVIGWCAVLTGFVVAQYQAEQAAQFTLSAQSRDLGALRAQLLVHDLRLTSVQNKDRARERRLEDLVFKLIDALTQEPSGKPSAYNPRMTNSSEVQ
jgi:uncharacterized membrane protein YccC